MGDRDDEFTDDEFKEYIQAFRSTSIDIENISMSDVKVLVSTVNALFRTEYVDPLVYLRRNMYIFPDTNDVTGTYTDYHTKLASYLRFLEMYTKENPDQAVAEVRQMTEDVNNCIAALHYAKESILNLQTQRLYCSDSKTACLPTTHMSMFLQPVCPSDMKPHQKLLFYYLKVCQERRLRKKHGLPELYGPVFTVSGDYTFHYKPVMDVNLFIYEAIYPYHIHPELWCWLTDRPSTPDQMIKHLKNGVFQELPMLNKRRYQWSFRNGVFDAKENAFYKYTREQDDDITVAQLDRKWTTAKYYDCDFDDATFESGMSIPTPYVQSILDSQNFPERVCWMLYASIGRLAFDVNSMDRLQYMIFLHGVAGSGKSTLISLIEYMYDKIDVGNLMNVGSPTFALEHIVDKFIYLCYDVDDRITLDQTTFQQMTSGEGMAIPRKFKVPVEKLWTTPGIMAGNQYPNWIDKSGNISRRMLVWRFATKPANNNPDLALRCRIEFPSFLRKCITCYHELLHVIRQRPENTRGLWHILPDITGDYFTDTKQHLRMESVPVLAFFYDEFTYDPNSSDTFSAADMYGYYQLWAKATRKKIPSRSDFEGEIRRTLGGEIGDTVFHGVKRRA